MFKALELISKFFFSSASLIYLFLANIAKNIKVGAKIVMLIKNIIPDLPSNISCITPYNYNLKQHYLQSAQVKSQVNFRKFKSYYLQKVAYLHLLMLSLFLQFNFKNLPVNPGTIAPPKNIKNQS